MCEAVAVFRWLLPGNTRCPLRFRVLTDATLTNWPLSNWPQSNRDLKKLAVLGLEEGGS
jgi:hypothetical protein